MKMYRVVEYDGDEEWLKRRLAIGYHGECTLVNGATVTATTLSVIDGWALEALEKERGKEWALNGMGVIDDIAGTEEHTGDGVVRNDHRRGGGSRCVH